MSQLEPHGSTHRIKGEARGLLVAEAIWDREAKAWKRRYLFSSNLDVWKPRRNLRAGAHLGKV